MKWMAAKSTWLKLRSERGFGSTGYIREGFFFMYGKFGQHFAV